MIMYAGKVQINLLLQYWTIKLFEEEADLSNQRKAIRIYLRINQRIDTDISKMLIDQLLTDIEHSCYNKNEIDSLMTCCINLT